MPYFDGFPTINYSLNLGKNDQPVQVRNIFFRLKIITSIKNNTLIYYPYYVKDNETPEDIAYKYYNDPTKHWVVLMANTIIDPQFDWPLSYDNFQNYMINKYDDITLTYQAIHHYELHVTTQTSLNPPNTSISTIDYDTYINTPEATYQDLNLQDGTTVHITTTTNQVILYDYEYELNEAKKNIWLLSKDYIDAIQQEHLDLTKPVS